MRSRAALIVAVGLSALIAQTSNAQPPPAPNNAQPVPRPAAANNRRSEMGYPAYDAAVVERGQKIFQANCGFCHGANAKGGETGPDLLRSVTVLDDENGNLIGTVVHNGRPDKGMPKFPLSDAQIADIATFLHSRVKAAALRGTYQILDIVSGNAVQGRAYFDANCAACHSVTGDLAHIGSKYDAVTVQQKVVMPREGRGGQQKPPRKVTVTLPSGESVSGTLRTIDDFSLSLTDEAGNYRSFTREGDMPKVTINDPIQAHSDMLSKYTDADIHNLTAYLVTVK